MRDFCPKFKLLIIFVLMTLSWILIPGYGTTTNQENLTTKDNSVLVSISIDNDTDFKIQAGIHGWSGNGSQSNPFVIKNLLFNNSVSNQPLIGIQNTRSFFNLANISLFGGSNGLFLSNVSNAVIENVSIGYSKQDPVYLIQAENIIIKDSYIFNSGLLSYNLLVDYSSNIVVENNTIFNSDLDGVKFRDSGSSLISGNTIQDALSNGIAFGNTENMSLVNNIIKENYRGVSIEVNQIQFNFTNNLIYNNAECGANIYGKNTSIMKNTFYNNTMCGLSVIKDTVNTTVLENNFIDNNNAVPFAIQILDASSSSKYDYNYYSDYAGSDNNNNGIVDVPYDVAGDNIIIDPHPRTMVYLTSRIHILTKPVIFPLLESSPYSGTIKITWGLSSDTFNHTVSYAIFYSNDNKSTWNLLAENINSSSYMLDTTKLEDQKDYFIKINVKDKMGFSRETILGNNIFIDNQESTNQSTTDTSSKTTNDAQSTTNTSSKTTNDAFTIYVTLTFLLLAGLFIIRNKNKKIKE